MLCCDGGEYGFELVKGPGVIMLCPPAVVSCVHPVILSKGCGGCLRWECKTPVMDAWEFAEACEYWRECECECECVWPCSEPPSSGWRLPDDFHDFMED